MSEEIKPEKPVAPPKAQPPKKREAIVDSGDPSLAERVIALEAAIGRLMSFQERIEARVEAFGERMAIFGGMLESLMGKNPFEGVAARIDKVEEFLQQLGRKVGLRKPKPPAESTVPAIACKSKVNRRIEGPNGEEMELSRGDIRSGELAKFLLETYPGLVESYPVKAKADVAAG